MYVAVGGVMRRDAREARRMRLLNEYAVWKRRGLAILEVRPVDWAAYDETCAKRDALMKDPDFGFSNEVKHVHQ
jgi:hypothetical protein